MLKEALMIRTFLHVVGSYLFWKEDAGLTNLASVELGFAILNGLALAMLGRNRP
jgi:hypothetical protein